MGSDHSSDDEQTIENSKKYVDSVPVLSKKSNLLSEKQLKMIKKALPSRESKLKWIKLFDSSTDGKSFSIFMGRICLKGPTLLIMKTKDFLEKDHVFGLYASQSWKQSSGFYGNSNCFLFAMNSENINVFRPSGINDHFQYLNAKEHGLGMGGQIGFFCFQINETFEWVKGKTKTSTFPRAPDITNPPSSRKNNGEENQNFIHDEKENGGEERQYKKIDLIEVYGFPLSEKDRLDLEYSNQMKKGKGDVGIDMFIVDSNNNLNSNGGMSNEMREKMKKEENNT